jgi:hypothetical protein
LCFCSSANAAFVYYLVDIVWVGVIEYGGKPVSFIRATDRSGAFTNRPFAISDIVRKEGLAAALAGSSLGRPVYILSDLNGRGVIPQYAPVTSVLLSN